MDYRSRQRAPNESNNNANLHQSSKQLAINTANEHSSQTNKSTLSSSSSLDTNDDLNNPLSSLQSISQRTLSSQSSSQQAMISSVGHHSHSHQQHHSQQAQQRVLNQQQQHPVKMNQQHQHQLYQRNNNANNIMQQNQNKQRFQQQGHRLNMSNGAGQLVGGPPNPRVQAAGSSGVAPYQHKHIGTTSHSMNGSSNVKSGAAGNNLLSHTHQHAASTLHNHSSSSADNMTTSSGDQTIDDLQQLARGYRNQDSLLNGNGKQQHSSSASATINKLSQYAYSAESALSPRFTLTGASSSTGSSGAGMLSAARHLSTNQPQSGSRFLLGVLFTLAEILLFGVLLLWLYWAFQHDDGLSWQADRKQQFNTHAGLMILGFIFLNGQGMLIYRSFQCCSKIYTKVLHTILFVLATSAIGLGLCLAYTAQENVGANNKPIMHFYSLHAWVGLSSISLFALQFSLGFISFLVLLCCDQATGKFRAALLPIHKTFGLIIFSLAISTCLTGLLQTARSRLSSKLGKIDYHELGEAGIVINVIGGCLICLAILMPYIIRNLDIKRPRDQILTTDRRLRLSDIDMRI